MTIAYDGSVVRPAKIGLRLQARPSPSRRRTLSPLAATRGSLTHPLPRGRLIGRFTVQGECYIDVLQLPNASVVFLN